MWTFLMVSLCKQVRTDVKFLGREPGSASGVHVRLTS
jgi:hypothetical protein